MNYPTFYRTLQIDGLSIFYRETGPADAPILPLLHGLPSSSRMFEPLFSRVSDRIEALIVQDAVAHDEGLAANWKTRRAFWADRAGNENALRTNLLSLDTTRTRHVGNDLAIERYNPDLWTDDFAFLRQPGQAEIQSDLFDDYQTNVASYPKWQAWTREKQPRLLVIWGKHGLSFELTEPEAYRRDVPNAEIHVLDAGHFVLDTAADEIAAFVQTFADDAAPALVRRAG